MSGRGKRLWPPHLDAEQAYQETLDFLKRCQQHNLPLALPGPALFRAYRLEGHWPMREGGAISALLKFGYDQDPQADQAKIAVARLLSVAVRAHYFLAGTASVPQEPQWFAVPDMAQPGAFRYGLAYSLLEPAGRHGPARQRTLVVAEWDLNLNAQRAPHVPKSDEFPVALLADPFTWLRKKRWNELRAEGQKFPWLETQAGTARAQMLRDIHAHQDKATFPYGTVLTCPIEIKEDAAAAGAMWARGIKAWFLPHGFDVEAVQAWLDKLSAASPDERWSLRWWEKRPQPRSKDNDS